MFVTRLKKGHLLINRIWFSSTANSKCDIIRYTRGQDSRKNNWYTKCDTVETIFSSLTMSTEEILAVSTKTVKYEVRKSMKEGININIYDSVMIQKNGEVIQNFLAAYAELVKETNNPELMSALSVGKIDNFIENNALTLSKAEKDGCFVYHIYANGDKECCLLYSASNFRSEDKNARNLTGRMNKLLHIKDMEYFRDRGLEIYDWGNINSSKNPNGIALFKMSFGGKVKIVYNIYVGITFRGKLIIGILKLLKLI